MLPRTANVELSCVSGVGSVDCLGRNQSGPNNDLVELTDEGSDKGPGGLDVKLTVDVGTGSVEVSRRG
jgi:predicted membrane protein